MKKVLFVLGVSLLLIACSPNEPKSVGSKTNGESVEKKLNALTIAELIAKLSGDNRGHLQRDLDFDKDILFVHVSEVNNEALHERPMGGIASQDAYIKDENTLYMFYDAKLPTNETNMIVMNDKFNHDYMLDYELINSEDESSAVNLSNIDNKYVDNTKRLFLDDKVVITDLGDGTISVSVDGEIIKIKEGEEKVITRTKDEIESELIIANYGHLNSIDNMKYEVLEDGSRVEDDSENSK